MHCKLQSISYDVCLILVSFFQQFTPVSQNVGMENVLNISLSVSDGLEITTTVTVTLQSNGNFSE